MNVPMLALDREQSASQNVTDIEEFRAAVLDGLSRSSRAIPARFLYDLSLIHI